MDSDEGGSERRRPFTDRGEDTAEILAAAIAQRDRLPRAPITTAARPGSGKPYYAPPRGKWSYVGPRMFYEGNSSGDNNHLQMGRINAVAYDPLHAGTYFAAAPWGGVWKTTNYGSNWTALTDAATGLGVSSFSSLAIDPVTPGIVYAGTGDYFTGGIYSQGLWKSVDGGATWSMAASLDGTVPQVVVDPDQPSTILASFDKIGVFRSTNGGYSWASVLLAGSRRFSSIVFGPRAGGSRTFYAAGEASNGSVLYSSSDHGATWVALPSPTSSVAQHNVALAVSPVNASRVYLLSAQDGKVWSSADAGMTWSDITGTLNGLTCQGGYNWMLACANYGGTDVLIAGTCNAWYSVGATGSWAPMPASHTDNHGIAVNPANPAELLTANDGGVDRYTYSGGNMSRTSLNATLFVTELYGAAYGPQGSPILGGTQDTGSPYTSSTTLTPWNDVYSGDEYGVAINQTNTAYQYVLAQWNSGAPYVTRTTDSSNSWADIGPPVLDGEWGANFAPAVLDPNNQNLLYVATEYVYRFDESTGEWANRLGGQNVGNPVNGLAIAETDSNRIYTVSGDGRIMMSVNQGASFVNINGNLPQACVRGPCDLSAVAVSPISADVVFVGYRHNSPIANQGRIWRCTNPTASTPTWTDISAFGTSGALPNNAVLSIAPDWTYPQSDLYVGTDIGVFYTLNSGASWTNATQPLGLPPNVPVVNVQSTPSNLYAATYGRGIWAINDYCPALKCATGACGLKTNACGDVICCGGGPSCCF
jgi:photosystem II stability/assembly factor-like uncharacterized protein